MQDVSVVILTKNSERVLDECLKSIAKNKPSEIIIIDGGSTDKTIEISRKYTNHLYKDLKGIASSRQMGAENAIQDVLAYIDSDVIVPEDFLSKMLAEREQTGFQGIEAQIVTWENATYWQWGEDECRKMFNKQGEQTWVGTRATLFDKEVIMQNKFDPLFKCSEDSDLSHRLLKKGYKLGRASVEVYHYHRETFKDWAKQRLWRGQGRAAFFYKYRWSIDAIRWFLGPSYTIFISTFLAVKCKRPKMFPILFLDGLLQGIGMLIELMKLSIHKKSGKNQTIK